MPKSDDVDQDHVALWFLGNAMGTVVLPRASAAAVMSRGLVRRAAILCGVSTFAAALAAMIVGGILEKAAEIRFGRIPVQLKRQVEAPGPPRLPPVDRPPRP